MEFKFKFKWYHYRYRYVYVLRVYSCGQKEPFTITRITIKDYYSSCYGYIYEYESINSRFSVSRIINSCNSEVYKSYGYNESIYKIFPSALFFVRIL